MTRPALGQFIRQRREAQGLTQTQLADRLGTHQTLVSAWERGRLTPDANKLARVAELLETPFTAFVDQYMGLATGVERAVIADERLNRTAQDALLAAYGVVTGRDSVGIASALRAQPPA
jgi:UDP-N-acetylglucosamine 1-carboxyvinyltransferase